MRAKKSINNLPTSIPDHSNCTTTYATIHLENRHPPFMKAAIRRYILWCAHRQIARNKAPIVAVTGSVGKSSTKEAIKTLLSEKFRVRANYGSLNNELGLPLAILGEKNGHNLFSWLWHVVRISWKVFVFDYRYDVLVLECGIDKPGDMAEILKLITPDISIITTVEESHFQNFEDYDQLINEKWQLAYGTKAQGLVIANYDNPPTPEAAQYLGTQDLITFGLNQKATYSAQDLQYTATGLTFSLVEPGSSSQIQVPLVGRVQAYIVLPAIIVAHRLGLTWTQIHAGLAKLEPLPGRLTVVKGINGSTLLESSYNASPASMRSAIEVLKAMPGKRKIAIVGDMRELGSIAPEAHQDILTLLAKNCTVICAFGPLYEAALQNLPAHTKAQAAFHHFKSREALTDFIIPKIGPGDVILIKGSQNTITLEKVSIELLADRSLAAKILPRQYGKWKHQDHE